MSQRKEIAKYLLKGHTLTPLKALRLFGCLRLGARIYELRRLGRNITTKMIKTGDKYVAQYSLKVK